MTTLDPSVERYLASVRHRDPTIGRITPMLHAAITHADASGHDGSLNIMSGWEYVVTFLALEPDVAVDLAGAINGVLARHAARPLLLEQLRASALLAAE